MILMVLHKPLRLPAKLPAVAELMNDCLRSPDSWFNVGFASKKSLR